MILKVRNWEKFQHYKDRRPPWIKLHFALLSSKDWVMLSDSERVLAIACMLVASQSDLDPGHFDADPEYIKRVAYLNSTPDFKPLIDHGFLKVIEADDSECKRMQADARPEKRREEKRRDASVPLASVPGLDENAWKRWCEYRREIRKPLKSASVQAAQRKLAAFGSDQSAVVEQSIANGWQGLFPLRSGPGSPASADKFAGALG